MVLAAIVGAHGVAGEVRLKLFAQNLASLKRHRVFDTGGGTLTLMSVRDATQGAIARFAEVTTREAAEALRGTTLAVARGTLPPPADDEVYVADLIGLPAVAEGAVIGRVVAVDNFGAGDLVEIARDEGANVLIPFARCTLEEGRLIVDPLFL